MNRAACLALAFSLLVVLCNAEVTATSRTEQIYLQMSDEPTEEQILALREALRAELKLDFSSYKRDTLYPRLIECVRIADGSPLFALNVTNTQSEGSSGMRGVPLYKYYPPVKAAFLTSEMYRAVTAYKVSEELEEVKALLCYDLRRSHDYRMKSTHNPFTEKLLAALRTMIIEIDAFYAAPTHFDSWVNKRLESIGYEGGSKWEQLQKWESDVNEYKGDAIGSAARAKWLWKTYKYDDIFTCPMPATVEFRRNNGWVSFFNKYVRPEFFTAPTDEGFAETGLTNTVAEELKMALIGVYGKDNILSGSDYPKYRRDIARRFYYRMHGLLTCLPDVIREPWQEFLRKDRIEEESKITYKSRRWHNLTVVEEGDFGEAWLAGSYKPEGKGQASIERDFVFPKVFVVCEGGQQAVNNYVMLMNRRTEVQCNILSQIPSIEWSATFYGSEQYKQTRDYPVNTTISYDYTLQGYANMIRTGDFTRYTRGIFGDQTQGWSAEGAIAAYVPQVLYRYDKCVYKLCTVDEYNPEHDSIGPAKAAVLIIEPADDAKCVDSLCATINKKLDHWHAVSCFFPHCENPWYLEEDFEHPNYQGVFSKAVELSRRVNEAYVEEWKRWRTIIIQKEIEESDIIREPYKAPSKCDYSGFRAAYDTCIDKSLQECEDALYSELVKIPCKYPTEMRSYMQSGGREYKGLGSSMAVIINAGILPIGVESIEATGALLLGTRIYRFAPPRWQLVEETKNRDIAFHIAVIRWLGDSIRKGEGDVKFFSVAAALYCVDAIRLWVRFTGDDLSVDIRDYLLARVDALETQYDLFSAFEREAERRTALVTEKIVGEESIGQWYSRNRPRPTVVDEGLTPYEIYSAWKTAARFEKELAKLPEDGQVPLEDCRYLSSFCGKYMAEVVRTDTKVTSVWLGDATFMMKGSVPDPDAILLLMFCCQVVEKAKFDDPQDERIRYLIHKMFGPENLKNYFAVAFAPREIREKLQELSLKAEMERPDIKKVDGKYVYKRPGVPDWFSFYGRD